MKIIHLADIHIRNTNSRHDEYREVFKKVYKKIEEYKDDEKCIVICGDIFDSKTNLSASSIELAKDFLITLSSFANLFVISGNHDHNQSTLNISNIQAICTKLKTKHRILYLDDTVPVRYKNVEFILTPMNSPMVTPIEEKEDGIVYISLHHGTLYNATTDDNLVFNNKKSLKASDFANMYHITCLGDIHKYQHMNKNKTVSYAGSLLQQNHSESINNHGMIIWDTEKLTSEFIEIENEYVFHTIIFDNKKQLDSDEKIKELENKKVRLRVKYTTKMREHVEDYIKKLQKMYTIDENTEMVLEEIVENKVENKEEFILDKSATEVYKMFLEKHEIAEEPEVTEKYTQLVNTLRKDTYKKMFELVELKFRNLFTYGEDNIIKFSEWNGLIMISGANGIGKSSLIDVILYSIYEKFSKGDGAEALNVKSKEGGTELKIKVNNVLYEIKREIRSKNKSSLMLYQNGENINENTKTQTEKKIREIFGEYEDMINTSVILQNGLNFIDTSDHDKKQYLSKILGLELYDDIYDTCSKESRVYSQRYLYGMKTKLETEYNFDYKKLIEEKKEEEEEYNDIIEELIEEEQDIIREETQLNEMVKKYKNINMKQLRIEDENNVKRITDLENSIDNDITEEKVEDLENQLVLKNKKLNTLTRTLKPLEKESNKPIEVLDTTIEDTKESILNLETSNNKLQKQIIKLLKKISEEEMDDYEDLIIEERKELKRALKNVDLYNKYKTQLEMLRDSNKMLLEHEFDECCKSCKKNKDIHEEMGYQREIIELEKKVNKYINSEENKNIYEERIEILEKIQKHKQEQTSNVQKLNVFKKELAEYERELEIKKNNDIVKAENKDIEHAIIELENNIIDITKTIKKWKSVIENNKKYNIEIEKLQLRKKELEEIFKNGEEIEDNINRFAELSKLKEETKEEIKETRDKHIKCKIEIDRLNNNKKQKEELEKEYNKLNKEYMIYQKILDIYNKGFREYVMKERINIVESGLNNITRYMVGFEIKILIDGKNIKIVKKVDDCELNIKSISGYQRFIINVGIRMILNRMNTMMSSNYIILDEGFSTVDTANQDKLNYILDKIKKEYKYGIIISHLDVIKGINAKQVNIIQQENGKSKIVE